MPSSTSILELGAQRAGLSRSHVTIWTGFERLTAEFFAPTAAEAEGQAKAYINLLLPPGDLRPCDDVMITTWVR